jgi:hypothetical protein
MKNRTPQYFATTLACVLALVPLAAQAHHAFATSFDVNAPVELRGKVVKVELINPHSWIHIDVVDENGVTNTWRIEGGSPNALFRNGINKNSVPTGSELHIVGYKARDGSLRAVGRDITFADGRPLFFGGSQAPGGTGN